MLSALWSFVTRLDPTPDCHILSRRKNLFIQHVGYKLPGSVAYFPTFQDLFDVQVEVSRHIASCATSTRLARQGGRFARPRALLLTALHSALRWLSYPAAVHGLLNFDPGRHFVR
jgi:hypothetical protein